MSNYRDKVYFLSRFFIFQIKKVYSRNIIMSLFWGRKISLNYFSIMFSETLCFFPFINYMYQSAVQNIKLFRYYLTCWNNVKLKRWNICFIFFHLILLLISTSGKFLIRISWWFWVLRKNDKVKNAVSLIFLLLKIIIFLCK